jgi:hypothetical protein
MVFLIFAATILAHQVGNAALLAQEQALESFLSTVAAQFLDCGYGRLYQGG